MWKTSPAHDMILEFIMRLGEACVDQPTPYVSWDEDAKRQRLKSSDPIDRVLEMLQTIDEWTETIEPLTGSQRFGNLAFRTWGKRLDEHLDALHSELLPGTMRPFITELRSYLQESFGSFVRIDYGTGHELNFLAWLCYLYRLRFFSEPSQAGHSGSVEYRIGLEVVPAYLRVVWHLQDRYSLEPAGSHGVWGLDDYQFVPYILGAAQLRNCTTLKPKEVINKKEYPFVFETGPRSGPRISVDETLYYKLPCEDQLVPNLYISSLARIYSLKRGPFHEHSPLLNDIANDVPSWSKVYTGMLKMYDAECLSKQPVIQHFVFGGVGFLSPRSSNQSNTTCTESRVPSTAFPKSLPPNATSNSMSASSLARPTALRHPNTATQPGNTQRTNAFSSATVPTRMQRR
ncbi:Serine/threonine-protein phosphatase 2A activator 1 [Malassezia yamatoensis]|uniref:Serine/threonine-protein phosphatase 2A activator n=1 Tax=Malassezia yamatoensis TaxID=253288 RepID=A0AAJ5YVR4_9BASI|nr:Serine/threonine-protein phosphatase 2A activator 1 [Malassezia yamatoensis]